MNDKEYMQDILLTAKTLTGLYHYAVQESSTECLHNQFKLNLNDSLKMQHDIYKAMENNGWYPSTQAQASEINQTRTKYQSGLTG